MKNILVIIIAMLMIGSCAKQDSVDEPTDIWNGYGKYLKYGISEHYLIAAQHDTVGMVSYGLDNGCFILTYECDPGYTLSETHMYAGVKSGMPLNKVKKGTTDQSTPKIGQFPNSTDHGLPGVESYTYSVPCITLPSVDPGFVVAAHCVVQGPDGYCETGWAEGDTKFTDKGWGWYETYPWEVVENVFTILYGTSFVDGNLIVFHIDVTNFDADTILVENVGNSSGSYDGAAYDPESGMLLFTKNANELWVNLMTDDDPSYLIANLTGEATSATFFNNTFYYVDTNTNNIYGVTFNTDWTFASETVLSTIPSSVKINDIAMSPAGNNLYMVGDVNGGGTELITWQVSTNTYFSTALAITYSGAQIAYGSDDVLYVIAPSSEDESSSDVFELNPNTGTLTVIEQNLTPLGGLSDITMGPEM